MNQTAVQEAVAIYLHQLRTGKLLWRYLQEIDTFRQGGHDPYPAREYVYDPPIKWTQFYESNMPLRFG